MPPVRFCSPQLQHTRDYMVKYYVKIMHVLLGVANNMNPLIGGGHKWKRSFFFQAQPKSKSFFEFDLIDDSEFPYHFY